MANQNGRAAQCQLVLEEADQRKCELIVSAFALAEVLHLKGQSALPKESRRKIRDFFKRSCFIVADVDRFIAEHAQELVWTRGISPKDAIHVATALATECTYLDTFDGPLMSHSQKVGGDPVLVICVPGAGLQQTLLLNDKRSTSAESRKV